MKKTVDTLVLKRFCATNGPFGKKPKSQSFGSGGQGALFGKNRPLDREASAKTSYNFMVPWEVKLLSSALLLYPLS
jgi:hypothetical protein